MFNLGDMVKADDMGPNRITVYGIVIQNGRDTIGVKWFNHPSLIPNDDGERYYTITVARDCLERVS